MALSAAGGSARSHASPFPFVSCCAASLFSFLVAERGGHGCPIIYSVRSFAKDLYGEMIFSPLISGIFVLNALKFVKIVDGGLEALQMDSRFKMFFYIYMFTLATVLPPSTIWLVLRRLTDDLRNMASRDPITDLLNRRSLSEGLQLYFDNRNATPACLLLMDADHFKLINDT